MDRPEWAGVNPANGEVYLTLTNGNATSRPLAGTDAANPRHYNDPRTTGAAQRGKKAGDVQELRFEIESHAAPRHHRVAPLPTKIESVEGIPRQPGRQRVELLSGSAETVNASNDGVRIRGGPSVGLARFSIVCAPRKTHCVLAPAR
jgi:hypothetical protein